MGEPRGGCESPAAAIAHPIMSQRPARCKRDQHRSDLTPLSKKHRSAGHIRSRSDCVGKQIENKRPRGPGPLSRYGKTIMLPSIT